MSATSKIEWTEATWNPTVGCTHVSAGCDHCYAAREASGRLAHLPTYAGLAHAGRFTGEVRLLADRLAEPLKWRKPRRVFVDSMSDLFHADVSDEFIARVFAVMAITPRHTYQVLTKRHARMRSLLSSLDFWALVAKAAVADGMPDARVPAMGPPLPLPNVWLGVSVEDQHWASIRIPALLDTPAAVRFVSCEPLLGPVDLGTWLPNDEPDATCSHCGSSWGRSWGRPHEITDDRNEVVDYCDGPLIPDEPLIDWVITGGESGPGARPMHPQWARGLRDQCQAAGVPFFFKQHGGWAPRGRLVDGEPLPVDNERTLILNINGQNQRGRAAGSLTNRLSTFSDGSYCEVMERVGKKAAGRELDGRTWDEHPA